MEFFVPFCVRVWLDRVKANMSMDNLRRREEEIVEAALPLPPEQRAAYLQVACGADAQLRERAKALLNAQEAAATLLELPTRPDPPNRTINLSLTLSEKPGDTIGNYKLLQQIGEGGCGVVYMAEQSEPVRRRVALKVIKQGMDTRSVIARFEAERQALALMDLNGDGNLSGATGWNRFSATACGVYTI